MENASEYYYNILNTTPNIGFALSKFYAETFGVQVTRSIVTNMNRLIKMFGRFTVYFAIIEMFGMEDKVTDKDNPTPLLTYFCKKRTEERYDITLNSSYEDLTKKIKEIEKKIDEVRKEK